MTSSEERNCRVRVVFETTSQRVKGVTFHPYLPWVLTSLHNGIIQLWDFRAGTLLDQFHGHTGPVRGVAFHPEQPLFASGGDDKVIRLWNLHTRSCFATINKHADYIRCLQFHRTQPWLLSSSDDQTVRIFNFQSRKTVAVLQGHSHYVMFAAFHPSKPLVASASLDATIRVWDISHLLDRQTSPSGKSYGPISAVSDREGSFLSVYGTSIKFLLEGHELGVNTLAWHPTDDMIVSGGDDKTIRLWRLEADHVYQLGCLRGHSNNVSAINFHPTNPGLLISNSEDRSLRVWNWADRTCLLAYKFEPTTAPGTTVSGTRFWSLSGSIRHGLVAAGHDKGLLVFRLKRSRVPATLFPSKNGVAYLDESSLAITSLKDGSTSMLCESWMQKACPSEYDVVDMDASARGNYVLVHCRKRDGTFWFSVEEIGNNVTNRVLNLTSGFAKWLTRDSVICLSDGRVFVMEMGSKAKPINVEAPATGFGPISEARILLAPTGHLLLSYPDYARLYKVDPQGKTMAAVLIGEVSVANVRDAFWQDDLVALCARHGVTLARHETSGFHRLTFSFEWITLHTSSAVWLPVSINANEVFDYCFVYSTQRQIKFLLPNGDSGVLANPDAPDACPVAMFPCSSPTLGGTLSVILAAESGLISQEVNMFLPALSCVASAAMRSLSISANPLEAGYLASLIASSPFGKPSESPLLSLADRLERRGLPGVALACILVQLCKNGKPFDIENPVFPEKLERVVIDRIQRLGLACGQLAVAAKCAEINKNDLSVVVSSAVKFGKIETATRLLADTEDPNLCTRKMLLGALTGDYDVIDDVQELLCTKAVDAVKNISQDSKILCDTALMSCLLSRDRKHFSGVLRELGFDVLANVVDEKPSSIVPPEKIGTDTSCDWPRIGVSLNIFDGVPPRPTTATTVKQSIEVSMGSAWDLELEHEEFGEDEKPKAGVSAWDSDLESLDLELPPISEPAERGVQVPRFGQSKLIDYERMEGFLSAYSGSTIGIANSVQSLLTTLPNDESIKKLFPRSLLQILSRSQSASSAWEQSLKAKTTVLITEGKDFVTEGSDLEHARELFLKSWEMSTLGKDQSCKKISSHYYVGISAELSRRELFKRISDGSSSNMDRDTTKMLELATVFAKSELDDSHKILAYISAMKLCFKFENLDDARFYAQELSDMGYTKANSVLSKLQQRAAVQPLTNKYRLRIAPRQMLKFSNDVLSGVLGGKDLLSVLFS
ncbi:hypothetical protein GEMRC1_000446 [Eukaryota sp. GEM-RC1]